MHLDRVLQNVTTLSHNIFDMCKPILIIFGRNVADKVSNQETVYFPSSPNERFLNNKTLAIT